MYIHKCINVHTLIVRLLSSAMSRSRNSSLVDIVGREAIGKDLFIVCVYIYMYIYMKVYIYTYVQDL
jgi:hypothetical protein